MYILAKKEPETFWEAHLTNVFSCPRCLSKSYTCGLRWYDMQGVEVECPYCNNIMTDDDMDKEVDE